MKALVRDEVDKKLASFEPSCPANDFEEDVALLVKKYVGTMGTLGNKLSNNFKGKTFGRRKCYNCDSPKHFVADCPYEIREEKYEKLTFNKKCFNKFPKRHVTRTLFWVSFPDSLKVMNLFREVSLGQGQSIIRSTPS